MFWTLVSSLQQESSDVIRPVGQTFLHYLFPLILFSIEVYGLGRYVVWLSEKITHGMAFMPCYLLCKKGSQ